MNNLVYLFAIVGAVVVLFVLGKLLWKFLRWVGVGPHDCWGYPHMGRRLGCPNCKNNIGPNSPRGRLM